MNNTTTSVPVEVWLPQDTYRRLDQLAITDETRIDLILAGLAERRALDIPLAQRRPRITAETVSYIEQLIYARLPVKAIAELAGVSRTTVYNHYNAWKRSA